MIVPFEVGSFLRAPYGWTMRMRREERHPPPSATGRVHLGVLDGILVSLALYGPAVVGVVVGWRAHSALWGFAVAGATGAFGILLIVPVMGLVMAFRHQRHHD